MCTVNNFKNVNCRRSRTISLVISDLQATADADAVFVTFDEEVIFTGPSELLQSVNPNTNELITGQRKS